jgi:hypothetical protein
LWLQSRLWGRSSIHAVCAEHELAKGLKNRVGRGWLQAGEALIELEYDIRASQEPACNLPITGRLEYIGNKIIFQTNVFDGYIRKIYVTLFYISYVTIDRHEVEGRGEVGNKAPAIETERDYFLLGVSSTKEVTENIEQAIKSVTGREMHVSVVEPLEEQ